MRHRITGTTAAHAPPRPAMFDCPISINTDSSACSSPAAPAILKPPRARLPLLLSCADRPANRAVMHSVHPTKPPYRTTASENTKASTALRLDTQSSIHRAERHVHRYTPGGLDRARPADIQSLDTIEYGASRPPATVPRRDDRSAIRPANGAVPRLHELQIERPRVSPQSAIQTSRRRCCAHLGG
jgi:hypothetical protein